MWLCGTRNNPSSFKNVGLFFEAGFTLEDMEKKTTGCIALQKKKKKSEGAFILGCEKIPAIFHIR